MTAQPMFTRGRPTGRSVAGDQLAILKLRYRYAADPGVLATPGGKLFFAGLMRRVSDLVGLSEPPRAVHRAEAVVFFRNEINQMWFCEAIGLSPEWVRQQLREVIGVQIHARS